MHEGGKIWPTREEHGGNGRLDQHKQPERERPPRLERSQAGQQSRGEDEGHKADPERRGALARGTTACGRGERPQGRSSGDGGEAVERR